MLEKAEAPGAGGRSRAEECVFQTVNTQHNTAALQEVQPVVSSTKVRFRSGEASSYLAAQHGVSISARTLDKLRCVGGGPSFQKFNRAVLYHRDALDAWALEKLSQPFNSTSEIRDA